jgi:hypothetical protein
MLPTLRPPPAAAAEARARLLVQYVGFENAPGRREYRLRAQVGGEVLTFTLSIALEAFAGKRALLQDGPDICYQKLVRALAGGEDIRTGPLAVTDADLASYRADHAAAPRRTIGAAMTPEAARTPR